MKRILLIICIVLVGAGLFAYPAASNYTFARSCATAAENYDNAIAALGAEALERACWDAFLYNKSLESDPARAPIPAGSGMGMAPYYGEVLNQGGVMGYIEIPKIAVKIPIYHGTEEETLRRGMGHLEGASLPTGGVGSHSVLTGYTGLAGARMFKGLAKLSEGDEFYLHILNRTLAYRVSRIRTALPGDAGDLQREPGIDQCTLIACHPSGNNSSRLLVRGERVAYAPGEIQVTPASAVLQRFDDRYTLIGLALGVTLLVFLIILTVTLQRREQRKKAQANQALLVKISDNPWDITSLPKQRARPNKPPPEKPRAAKFWWEEQQALL